MATKIYNDPTKIYNDPWSPSNINCNWKPEKLSRYSFIANIIDYASNSEKGLSPTAATDPIDFNDSNVSISKFMAWQANYPYYYIGDSLSFNLTGKIFVNPNTYYYYKCEKNVTKGLYTVFFFNSSDGYLGYKYYFFNSRAAFEGNFKTPANCSYIRITLYKEAWEKFTLRSGYTTLSEKDTTPLDIVDNKVGVQIYKDLHFEVYVKAEALIKNFVDCFSLRAFQRFPSEASYWYESTNSVLFQAYTSPYYTNNYIFNNFEANHAYSVGDKIKYAIYNSWYSYYYCIESHTSASTYEEEMTNNSDKWIYLSFNDYNWLQITNNIKEKNYNSEIGFPYVGSLLFKDLWGCDMINYLKTFTKRSNLTLYYHPFFAEKLRNSQSYYDKFFDEGYFAYAGDYSGVEGFGIRLIRGENFRNDEILGDLIANNYLNFGERKHNIPENWSYSDDSVVINNFGGGVIYPFDHYYQIYPKGFPNASSLPFFKEKSFEDFSIELVLQRKDVFGNIFQRIVNLPIFVNFYNNLIKIYFRNNHNNSVGQIYTSEYLPSSSNYEHYFTSSSAYDYTICRFTIWCPNIERLSLNSTIVGPLNVRTRPSIVTKNGQVGVVKWEFDTGSGAAGKTMRAVHTLEYSDGENYDKFTYIEKIGII